MSEGKVHRRGGGMVLCRKGEAVWISEFVNVALTDQSGRYVGPDISENHPQRVRVSERQLRVRAPRHRARPPGVKASGCPGCVVVLARAPVVRDFEVQQSQETCGSEDLDVTDGRTTVFLDRGHAGNVEGCPKGDSLDTPRYLYSGSGQIKPRLARRGSACRD
jgi:hypothetical protein